AQALAIANGTEGVDVITCTDFSELFRELCRHYLEQDDPDHPVCTCYLPGGTLYLRKKEKGISLVVGGFIWPVSLMRDATDQERNAMLLNVLTNFNFQQDGENQWRAVLAPAMTRHFVEKAFSQLPFDTRASSQFAIVLSPAGHYTPA
ncbi:MAG: hypothetical protein KDE58_31180, partial [Caldilineaceae bacterium]|nr:hypothetical protein [Caldilineaceae bacterium]